MRKILPIIFFFMLLASDSIAQCGGGEVEIKVEIATDIWGGETSWTISDLDGVIILQGGQGGVYQSESNYADSICVASDGCFFFEIYDTYGDGIFAPNGYALFVDEILVASGSDDIGAYQLVTTYCPASCSMVFDALTDLQDHISGVEMLSPDDLLLVRDVINQFPECLADSEAMILMGKNIVETYDDLFGALFTTPNTENGFFKDPSQDPGLELERALLAVQQAIFDYVFTPEVFALYPQHIDSWTFNSCFSFPGYVDPPSDPQFTASALIRANFQDPDGMNPYFEINGDGTNHALRPTGLYLSPGTVASVTVPETLVGQDYYIRVGSHEWDLTDRPFFKRLDRISKKFPINASTVEVFNPLGGAISILVPFGASEGIVEVEVVNGVESPFFSLKSFYQSPDFDAELDKPGPWAVFETDNVMFTIPTHSIVPGEYDLMQALLDWDAALQGVNSILAREIVPDKHNFYQIADVTIRFGAFSIGYPMSNHQFNYTDVPGPAFFIDGPGPNDEVNFHESGHAWAISKFPGEIEAIVNFPYIMAMNYGLGVDLDEAVNYSFVPNTFDIDRTATHRMVSNTFGGERDISNTTTDEVRYQHRGYGHYFEMVNILGWCPIRNFWKQEYIDFENGIDHGINNQDIDSRIIRLCEAAQIDLRPLFHVFGILPQAPEEVESRLNQLYIEPSLDIYNRLQAYFDLIPEDNEAFTDYALSVYPNLYDEGPNADPNYGVGWHYLKSLSYDNTEAQERTGILQDIIDLYFPDGEPTENGNAEVCCLLDTININLENGEVVVTGGVEPYDISIDMNGNTQTVTVIDFDGCESTAQFIVSGLEEKAEEVIRIYPNPASNKIYIELSENRSDIEHLQLVSINGQVLKQYPNTDRVLDISTLGQGVYIIQIRLARGVPINKRFLVLKE
jgi:hypothetical protein